MPKISFHQKFLIDLANASDPRLPLRVFKKLFSETGDFRTDRDDHRYKGIDNGWIRVISRGSPGFRVVYIYSHDEILLYRAGPHSIEDNLVAPNKENPIPMVSTEIVESAMQFIGNSKELQKVIAAKTNNDEISISRFMKNHERRLLYEQMIGRRLIPHQEVFLVSPFLSFDILRTTNYLGTMLDQWIVDGCKVTLITMPPKPDELDEYNNLEARGFSILYVQKLHAKAYLFKLDRTKLNPYQQHHKDLAFIGSANLTNSGLNPNGDLTKDPQLELSYQVENDDHLELENFIIYLAAVGTSHDIIRNNIANYGGTPR